MHYAKLALRDIDSGTRAIHDVAELSRGRLRIAATPTFTPYLTVVAIDHFNREHPGITIDLHEITQAQIEAMLGEDEVDLGIGFERARSAEVESRRLFSETLSLVVGAGHPRAECRDGLPGEVLESEPLILLNGKFATRRHIDDYCHSLGITPNVVIDANSIGVILEIVRRGRLATILPDRIDLTHSGLRPVALTPSLPVREAVLLWRKGAYRSAASKAFEQLLSR
jgi:LysR family cyn operon transcriptional activator